jgi:hypothetical protein
MAPVRRGDPRQMSCHRRVEGPEIDVLWVVAGVGEAGPADCRRSVFEAD